MRATVADDPNFTVERTELSLYDNRGRMLHMITPEGTLSYDYDDLGRKTYTAINADLSAIDSATGIDSLPADPTTAERVTAYGYDILGRLVSVQEDATPSDDTDATQDTDYVFDLQGRMARMVTGTTHQVPSLMTVMAYDSLGRLDTMVDSDGAGNITASYDYEVRADGRRTSSTETFWIDDNEDGVQTPDELQTTTYNWTYDAANRLTDEVLDHWDDSIDQSESFTYDLTGNRTRLERDKGNDGTIDQAITYSYDVNDRLLEEVLDDLVDDANDTTTSYAYDQTQQTEKTVTSNGQTVSRQLFTYDVQGRLASVTNEGFEDGNLSSRTRTSYQYDSTGYRIELVNEVDSALDGNFTLESRTEFLSSRSNFTGYAQTIRETTYDADGNVTKTIDYTFGADEISQRVVERDADGNVTSDETHLFGHDGHGSVRVLYDLAGSIEQLFTFSSYGVMVALHNATGQSIAVTDRLSSLGYSGEHFDAKAGQQYLRARFYNPSNGRFNRLDPFVGNNQDPQSLHKYAYVHADPIGKVDPTGLFSISGMLAGTTIGAYIDASYNARVVQRGLNVGAFGATLVSGYNWLARAHQDTVARRDGGPLQLAFPDAITVGLSTATAVSLLPGGILGAAGFGATAGVEALYILNDPGAIHIYGYIGGVFASAGSSLSLSVGWVYGVQRPEDYTRTFVSASASLTLPKPLSATVFRLIGNGWPSTHFVPSTELGFEASVFYDPTNLLSGSYGFSFGATWSGSTIAPFSPGDNRGGIGFGVARTGYAYLGRISLAGAISAPGNSVSEYANQIVDELNTWTGGLIQ